MRRLIIRINLWLCSRGYHRGDMLWTPGAGSTIDCRSCGQTVSNR